MQTLLIPYLCWNLLYYVGYLAGSRIPAVADIVNRPDLQFSLKEMLEALELYYRTFFLGEDIDIEDDGED